MLLYILLVVHFLDEITTGPFPPAPKKEKKFNVIDGSFIRQAFRALEDQDYKGRSN